MEERREAIVDGRTVAYKPDSKFHVQTGRGLKGKYATRYTFTGNLVQALLWYNGINIGPGFKKRLVMSGGFSKVVITRSSYI